MADYTRQPLRTIYLIYEAFGVLLFRLPLWLLVSLPRPLRPRPTWTFSRAFRVRMINHLAGVSFRVGGLEKLPNHLALAEGADINGVWIDPVPDVIFGKVKEWATAADVSPVRIPGYWMTKPESTVTSTPQAGEKVVLALHGGAYVALSAYHKSPTSNIARGLLQHAASVHRVFSPEYRLSKGAPYPITNPFPAALLDAIASYHYLVNVADFAPEDIIVEGDSAGGNLALALVRYLVEHAEDLAEHAKRSGTKPLLPPGGVILLSPWADIGSSHDLPPPRYLARSDYIGNASGPSAKYPHRAFTGPLGLAAADTNAYISPASKAPGAERPGFVGWPSTFLVAGGVEWLAPSIRILKERMSENMGEGRGPGQLCYHEAPDGVHDYVTMPWHEPERTETLSQIAEWIGLV